MLVKMSALSPSKVQNSLDSQQEQRKSFHWKPASESHLDLLHDGTFSDVTFIVGPKEERIPCHQLFLKARSPVFETMFSVRWNQDSNTEVLLEDVDPKIFKKFLQYIYADTLVATVYEVLELLQLAHKYDVQLLLTRCEELLGKQLTLDVAVDAFQAARKSDRMQLMDKVGDLMAKSMSELETLPSFARMDKQTLLYMLKRNDLNIKEVDAFRLAVKWAKNQPGWPVEQSLEEILPLIRFPIMTPNEFTTAVVPTGLLSESTLVELFTYFGTTGETKKALASTLKFSTERRQSADLTALVALYSADFAKCKIKRQTYLQISECLQFNIENVRGVGLFNRLSARLGAQPEKKRNIALSGITVYFPTTCATNSSEDIAPTLTKEFRVVLKAMRSNEETYTELFTCGPLKAQGGKLTDVEFGAVVPLESGVCYAINVEEIISTEGKMGAQDYEVRDFGNIQRSVTTTVGDSCVCFGNIFNNNAFIELSGIYTSPRLIYKLRLKEWLSFYWCALCSTY